MPIFLLAMALSALPAAAQLAASGEKWIGKERYAEFRIVVSPDAPQADKEAAEEFKRLWSRATGLDIPIRTERDGGVTVWIGAVGAPKPMLLEMNLIWDTMVSDRSSDIAMEQELSGVSLPNGGYCIRTIGESLLIIGNGRTGTRSGVEAFFRDHFGYQKDGPAMSVPEYLPRMAERWVPTTTAGWYLLKLAVGLAALFAVHWAFNRYYGEEVPVPWALILAIGALTSCIYFFYLIMELLSAVWGPYAQPLAPILTFGVFFWPVRGYVITLMQGLGRRSSQFMYGDSGRAPLTGDDYIPPQVYKVSYEVNDKVQEFRRIFAADPSSPRGLFEAAQLLEHNNYYDESAEMYREIIQLFHKDQAVWAEANFRLASLHENALFNRGGAVDILKRIVSRAPDTEYGRLAKTRLAEMDAPEAAGGLA